MTCSRAAIGSALILVAPIPLTFRDNSLCLATTVGSQRLANIHLFVSKLTPVVAPRVTFVTFMGLDYFS